MLMAYDDGDKEARARMIAENLTPTGFDVCITSYEMVIREQGAFRKFSWRYLIVDEAHRMKNEESKLSQVLRSFSSRFSSHASCASREKPHTFRPNTW